MAQVFLQHRAVEGADGLDIQGGSLFKQRPDLGTVFAHDADIVPAGFIVPGLLHIQGAEFPEAVSGEQDLVQHVIGHNDLGPVDHGGGYKGQGVPAQAQGVPLPYHHPAVRIVGAEEIHHHVKGFCGGDDDRFRVELHEIGDVGGMVRLHMLHHQIIRLPAPQNGLNVIQPLVGKVLVHGVHDGDLVVQDHIGIVSHAVGHPVLPLKQVHLVVVHAYITDIIGNKHRIDPLSVFAIDSCSYSITISAICIVANYQNFILHICIKISILVGQSRERKTRSRVTSSGAGLFRVSLIWKRVQPPDHSQERRQPLRGYQAGAWLSCSPAGQ